MNEHYFSIVAAMFNTEEYVDDMVESVRNQSYDDWELIIVDDGSTDQSGNICDALALNDKRIKVVHTENRGGIEARYTGISYCTGEYIIVIDADDRLTKNCLQKVKDAIEISCADMIIWGFCTFGAESRDVNFSLEPFKIYSQKKIMYTSLMYTCHSLCIRAIHKDIMKKSCSCTLGNLSINTDYAMLIPILCNIESAYVIDDILYEYRIYNTSVSHSISVKKIEDTDKVSLYAINEFKKNRIYDQEIETAIYVSYLKMIIGRLFTLFLNGMIDRQQCRAIHLLPIYRNSLSYERHKYFSIKELAILKCFRKSFYLPFYILYYIKKVKDKWRDILNVRLSTDKC